MALWWSDTPQFKKSVNNEYFGEKEICCHVCNVSFIQKKVKKNI